MNRYLITAYVYAIRLTLEQLLMAAAEKDRQKFETLVGHVESDLKRLVELMN